MKLQTDNSSNKEIALQSLNHDNDESSHFFQHFAIITINFIKI